ncbi:hypothetical protein GCM10008927_03070 [Amylibacter ulvae]|uniref:TadE-like domain-containing protein n=1 Tax=Paramylibacter ulvae TaxID=1651968 RepID=A0ABQ3CXY6_9RHOB|nr:TadE/TadG family type IV pilus assembly protein [Amylibacter ulvae]GHA42004.1 hypothetical protein GCM10008927_03070 [Amylibacter ulvae]
MSKLRNNLKRFWQKEEGTSTLEFIFIFPLFFFMFALAIEGGWFTAQKVFLERAVDISVRNLRLGKIRGTAEKDAYDVLKDEICEHAGIVNDCANSMKLEMYQLSPDESFTLGTRDCVERKPEDPDAVPTRTFTMGNFGDVMFVRACIVVDPLFSVTPITPAFELDNSGGFFLSTYTAYAVEPEDNDFSTGATVASGS